MLRKNVTDLGKIVDNIDEAEGRNDAIRLYIYCLRDLQREYEVSSYRENALITAQNSLNTATCRPRQPSDGPLLQ